MAYLEITCIIKPNVNSPHDHITHVGNPTWTPRLQPVEQIIREIKSGVNSFYVSDWRGNQARVHVVNATQYAREHIRTYADTVPTDNLLSLNQCTI